MQLTHQLYHSEDAVGDIVKRLDMHNLSVWGVRAAFRTAYYIIMARGEELLHRGLGCSFVLLSTFLASGTNFPNQ